MADVGKIFMNIGEAIIPGLGAVNDWVYKSEIKGSSAEWQEGSKSSTVLGGYVSTVIGARSQTYGGLKNDWIVGNAAKIGLAHDHTTLPYKSEWVVEKTDLYGKSKWSAAKAFGNAMTMGLVSLSVTAKAAKKKREIAAAEDILAELKSKKAKCNEEIGKLTKKAGQAYENYAEKVEKALKLDEEHVQRQVKIAKDAYEAEILTLDTELQRADSQLMSISGDIVKVNENLTSLKA